MRPAAWRVFLLVAPLHACTGAIGQGDGRVPEPAPGGGDLPGDTPRGGATGPGGGGGGAGGGRQEPPQACSSEAPGLPIARRLTGEELARTLEVLLGRSVSLGWPQDELEAGYPSARENAVLEPHARNLYSVLLPELRQVLTASPATLSSACTTPDARCADALLSGFAARAWRRPLAGGERAALLGIYESAKTELGDAKEATAHLLLTILSSPHFLYRTELGEGASGARRLTSREVGTALAYFFWGQPPDVALLAKMEGKGLETEAQILVEIDRLRASPAHAAWMGRFFQQWTHIENLEDRDHEADTYPDATKAYKREAEEAAVRQFVGLVSKPGATFEELVAGTSFVAGPLTAKAYRAGAKPTGFTAIEADGGRRGIFTSVGFLTQYSKPDRPSAIDRAKFFLDSALCMELPGIPADALQREFLPDPKRSPRQNFEGFTAGAACSPCHAMLNPIGFAFDKYGADGQALQAIEGFPVVTRGTVQGAGDLDGEIAGPEELIAKLAKSRQARGCFIKQFYRFTNGRKEGAADDCTVQGLLARMERDGDALTVFARHYFTSRNFLYRQPRETP